MNGVETYLVDTALNSDPFRRLGEETNPLQSYQDGYEIWQSLSLPISGNRSLSGMVMFSLLNNQIFSRSGSLFGNTLEQKAQTWDALESGILRLLQTGPLNTERGERQCRSATTRTETRNGIITAWKRRSLLRLPSTSRSFASSGTAIRSGQRCQASVSIQRSTSGS